MRKVQYIVVTVSAVCLCSCGSAKFPMDDAYHIPSEVTVMKESPAKEASLPAATPTTQTPKETTPTVVFTQVKDTTVTAVIKRK